MIKVIPEYVSALEARDIRRYPNEIAKIPERDSMARDGIDPNLTFSQIASSVTDPTSAIPPEPVPHKAASQKPFTLWENQSFGFGDLVDIINPLQHMPVVATIYRNMTGDKIGFVPRIIGGAIWGRIGGFVSAVINGVVEFVTGRDVGDHIFDAVFGPPAEAGNAVATAPSVPHAYEATAAESTAADSLPESSEPAASWQNSFALDDPFAELTGHLAVPSADQAVQSARPATAIIPAKLSALGSYGSNAIFDAYVENSTFRAVA
jgi:hypothetical protein